MKIKSTKFLHVLTIVTGIYLVYYLGWRIAYTINPTALVLSILLLAAEAQGILNFFLFAMMTRNTEQKETPAPLNGVSVDVYIPTYNEDLSILEATMTGCISMRGEHRTYVLDDGRRPEVKALADRMGCGYLTRPDNKHAKAGNLNAALKQTDGELIVVLDADMVPQPDLLEKTLGYFRDEKTAIVQLPQEFYNLDSVQHQSRASDWHEQQLFYRVIQPGKDNINAAFWCGSPSVVRRSALESIGGVATDSITEDFLTSIRLNAKGWRIRYHNEALAYGIAPQSLHAFNLQRHRWAQGAMKIFRSKDNPLIVPGLTLRQRLSHFAAIFTYFDAYQKLIYLLAPAIFLMTGAAPLKVNSGLDFATHWVPYFVLMLVSNLALGRGYFKYFAVEKYNTLKMFTFIKASVLLLIPKNTVFKVTPKSADSSVKALERRQVRVEAALLLLIILSVFAGMTNVLWHIYLKYGSFASVAAAIGWSLLNSYILFTALRDVLIRAYQRQDYRFPTELQGRILLEDGSSEPAAVMDLSMGGISMQTAMSPGEAGKVWRNGTAIRTQVALQLPDGELSVAGKAVFDKECRDGSRKLGMKFEELSGKARERLNYYLFVTLPRISGGSTSKGTSSKGTGIKGRGYDAFTQLRPTNFAG